MADCSRRCVRWPLPGAVDWSLDLSALPGSDLEKLFNEELGVVIQVRSAMRIG